MEETSWWTAGTAETVFNKSLSLFHRNSSPETRRPTSHMPANSNIKHTCDVQRWRSITTQITNHLPFWDADMVSTLCSSGWSFGIFFLVRPETKCISLIRLSSNRKTPSFSWKQIQLTCNMYQCLYETTADHFLAFDLTLPSQQNLGHGFLRLMLDDNKTSNFTSILGTDGEFQRTSRRPVSYSIQLHMVHENKTRIGKQSVKLTRMFSPHNM